MPVTRSALVTGATGFIGGKLAQRLAGDGWSVHAILRGDSDESTLPPETVIHRFGGQMERLAEIVNSVMPDTVFHLASLYLATHRSEQIDSLVQSNITFPTQLAEAMIAAGCRKLVNTGTAWQNFGGDQYNPVNLYAATKQSCTDILKYYHEAHGLSVVTLKLFDTFGAGDMRRKLVQILVDAAATGETFDMSPGEQVVDMTHVDDVIEAFVIAADRLAGAEQPVDETYFLSGERLKVRELVALVSDQLARPVNARLGGFPYRQREVMMPVAVPDGAQLPGWHRRNTLRSSVGTLVRGE